MRSFALGAALVLASCGSVQTLRPKSGEPLPKATAALAPPTPEQLTTPDTQARPTRIDDVLQRSEKRKHDRFDPLPPR